MVPIRRPQFTDGKDRRRNIEDQKIFHPMFVTMFLPVYQDMAKRFNRKFSALLGNKRFQKTLYFLFGVILAVGLYELIIVDLEFPPDVSFLLGFAIGVMLGVANMISIQVRCVSMLTIPTFCGRTGRSVLRAVVVAMVLAGPVSNLAFNGKEFVRVFSCSASLVYNMTKTRVILMVSPFQEAIFGIKADTTEIKKTLNSVTKVVNPISEELEGSEEMKRIEEENDYIDELQGDSKRSEELAEKYATERTDSEADKVEKKYERKLEERCEEELSRGAGRCRTMMAGAYDRCYSAVSVFAAWLLCWPMKLSFFCNIIEALGGKQCDSSQILEPGTGEGFLSLRKMKSTFSEGLQDVHLQYHVHKLPRLLNVREASETAQEVMQEIKRKKQMIDQLMTLVMRLAVFAFVRVINDSQEYHNKYLSDIRWDNVYLTRYFRRIDARRHSREVHSLLPLKKVEKPRFVDPYSLFPAPLERSGMIRKSLRLILEIATVTTIILLDWLLYELLALIAKHALIHYTQTGSHDLLLKVKGTGMIAKLVRSIIKGFNIKKRVKTHTSNEACLPKAKPPNVYYICKIFGIYFSVWLLIISDAYTQRMRRTICAHCYPKQEKKRVLHLYNETLKMRVGLFRHLRKKVIEQAKTQRLELDANILMVMRLRYPNCCSWLRFFSSSRRRCLICSEPEPRAEQKSNFYICSTPRCHFVHCNECWKEIGKVCYACTSYDSSSSEEYETDEI